MTMGQELRPEFDQAPTSAMKLSVSTATPDDAGSIATLRNAVAAELTRRHGRGHWSSDVSERAVLRAISTSRVIVARRKGALAGTLCLATKKPWAIDKKYFAEVRRPLYLLDMAVAPGLQRNGIGRHLVEEAAACAREWPAQSIRLDAYDAEAGAGPFYAKCGFREVGRVTYRGVPLIYYELLL
jgi:GNAT superfamily N-acetyltransferase